MHGSNLNLPFQDENDVIDSEGPTRCNEDAFPNMDRVCTRAEFLDIAADDSNPVESVVPMQRKRRTNQGGGAFKRSKLHTGYGLMTEPDNFYSRSCKEQRKHLSSQQEIEFEKKICPDSSDDYLQTLVDYWNADNNQPPISLSHLQRIRGSMPKFKDHTEFWASVEEKVMIELSSPNVEKEWGLPSPKNIKQLDDAKIPTISEDELRHLRFDFNLSTYEGNKDVIQSEFRDHLYSNGIAIGPISDLVSPDDRINLERDMTQGSWLPSSTSGPWKIVSEYVVDNGCKIQQKNGATFGSAERPETRISPNLLVLKDMCGPPRKPKAPIVHAALCQVLRVCEAVYRLVLSLLPTSETADTRRRTYGSVQKELTASFVSIISCMTEKTKVQLEHMDDHLRGISALWGLVEHQYVIVWLNSYQLNLELERIAEFRASVMSRKPAGWSDDAFWNLVAGVHLENSGFGGAGRPRPVKVPLAVGDMMLFDFMVVHAGMPFVKGLPSLRGHMYFPVVAGRGALSAADITCFPWDTNHALFPGWRIIAKERQHFL